MPGMRCSAALSGFTGLAVAGQVLAAPPHPLHANSSYPLPTMEQQARRYLHPFRPCADAINDMRTALHFVSRVDDTDYRVADDGLSMEVSFTLFDGRYHHTVAFPTTAAAEASTALRHDAATGGLLLFLYRPMTQGATLLPSTPLMMGLVRPDPTRGICQRVAHFPLPDLPDEQLEDMAPDEEWDESLFSQVP